MENTLFESEWMVAEKAMEYGEGNFPLQDETRIIIGICMEVHRYFGPGFLEVIYKDAVEKELQWKGIPFEREKTYKVDYKGEILARSFSADFVIHGNILFEAKAQVGIIDQHYKQVLNYLAVTKCPIALLINFGETSLRFKRVALFKNKNIRENP
jgi:GxxExxY protein